MSFGIVLYAQDIAQVAGFYAELGGWRVLNEKGYATVDAPEFEIVVVRVHAGIAATLDVTDPPERRTSTPLKLAIPVPSIAAARETASHLGGVVDPIDQQWRFGSTLVCDGHDPEGNVFQLREIN